MRLPNSWEHMPQRKLSFAIIFIACIFAAGSAMSQQLLAPQPQTGSIVGTVTDFTNYVVPDATVVLQGPNGSDKRSVTANDNGFFSFDNVKPGVPYHIKISAKGFADWVSPALTIAPGQYMELTGIDMKLAVAVTTVTASVSQVEIATQQVEIAEKQRVLGIIPNFYVVYDKNSVPLPAKLKFKLALRTSTDPITILGSAFVASIDQAGDTPNYGQGWDAYAKRFGANYANGLTDIFVGGAILPSLLHQDPRYWYQGTGTKKSRALHAISDPIICKGDNGRWQPNFSSLGGYLASGAIANAYYPESNRGPGLVFSTFGIDVAANMANGLIQEFLLRKLTPSAKNGN
jgi:Carboxypeptidase regulatory-like domain